MPELPEVETIRRQLLPLYRGKEIADVRLKTPQLLKNCEPAFFSDALRGQTIENMSRKGKFLIVECSHAFPVFHLGMSGIFLKDPAESRYPQHIHLDIDFTDGSALYFQDMRKFGKIWLYQDYPALPNLGIDPISEALSEVQLKEFLGKRSIGMKNFLMNQKPITGIGNIYASEILFRAGISPYRRTDEVNAGEVKALHESIHTILEDAIDRFGTTYSAYRTVEGESGSNQNFLKVYQREGLPCTKCGSSILKSVIGSRSTFFCDNCQQ